MDIMDFMPFIVICLVFIWGFSMIMIMISEDKCSNLRDAQLLYNNLTIEQKNYILESC